MTKPTTAAAPSGTPGRSCSQSGFTREEYDRICRRAKERGIKILTKYRKGLKSIRCGEIVLREW